MSFVCFCLSGESKRPDAAAIASIGAALQARRIVLLGDDKKKKEKIVKEFGDSEQVSGRYVLKEKDLQESVTKVVLFV